MKGLSNGKNGGLTRYQWGYKGILYHGIYPGVKLQKDEKLTGKLFGNDLLLSDAIEIPLHKTSSKNLIGGWPTPPEKSARQIGSSSQLLGKS